ncbi:MAG TPA: type II toxin-antitoxin system VapC family toxin [Gemmatimonadales bacterium]|nr:type II toxin-antitoxin system VapC family toxin [Gemmatimonadales bacterium]
MIVVDTNVLAYLFLPGRHTGAAARALARDPDWLAPRLWRSELRSVLAQYLRAKHLTLPDALAVMDEAAGVLAGGEHEVGSRAVFLLVASSRCSAYDCEFVALARAAGVPLVTVDREILRAFPETAVALEEFAAHEEGL